jgi:hypothetical protein
MTLRGSFDDSEAGDHDPIATASLDLLNYSPRIAIVKLTHPSNR